MREALRAYLAQHSLAEPVVIDVLLAAEEALNNAILHVGEQGGMIRVSASVCGGHAAVEVQDCGRGFDFHPSDPRCTPDTERPCGRGLFLIEHVMDEVTVSSDSRGTTVRMVRRVA